MAESPFPAVNLTNEERTDQERSQKRRKKPREQDQAASVTLTEHH